MAANQHVIGHNFWFDRRVLQVAFKKVGVYLPLWNFTCTQDLAMKCGLPSKLEELAAHCKIAYPRKHDAKSDATVTMKVYEQIKHSLNTMTSSSQ